MKKHHFRDSIYIRFLFHILMLTLISAVLILVFFSYISHQQNTQEYALNTQVSRSVIATIENNRQFVSQVTHSLLSSKELISFLENDYSTENDYLSYVSSVQSYVQATLHADPRSDIYIYMENPNIPMSMDVFYHLSDIADTPPLAEFLDSNQIELWLCESDFPDSANPYLFPTKERFIYLRKAYNYKKKFLGLLVFSIPENYFLTFEAKEDSPILSAGHNRIVNLTGRPINDVSGFLTEDSGSAMIQKGQYLVTKESPDHFPFSIIVVTKTSDNRFLLLCFLALTGLFAMCSIFLCLRNLRNMELQMNRCLTAMDASINNNYRTRVPVEGNNEISHICRRINLLLNQAAELSRQNVLKETSNKESQLIALQHQINPHFIYNTMEVFSSRMKLYGHYDDSDAMVAFANIFRYNVTTDNSIVPIHEEIRQAMNFFYIQQLRYPQIRLDNEIPGSLSGIGIPKFTLQPIIENAIVHGIVNSDDALTITLKAESASGGIRISILDNGAGIPPEDLMRLNTALKETNRRPRLISDGHSVGLKNVNARLKLFFGEESHLALSSKSAQGVCVSFFIPCR